jgi:hypothetical protein
MPAYDNQRRKPAGTAESLLDVAACKIEVSWRMQGPPAPGQGLVRAARMWFGASYLLCPVEIRRREVVDGVADVGETFKVGDVVH